MNSFSCKHCNKIFQKKSILNRHLKSHLSVKPYQCNMCDQRFTQNSSLLRHQSVIHTKEKKFQCPSCNLKFSQKYNVDIHIKRVHSIKENGNMKHPCTHCSCVFNKLNSLNRHVAQIHTNSKDSNEFDNDSFGVLIEQLKMLQNCSNNIETDNIDLYKVPEKFLSDSQEEGKKVDQNKIVSNSDDNPITISIKTQYKMQKFSCPDCGRIFQRKFDLSRHSRIHNQIKPFSCEKCNRSFTLKCTLDRHMKTHLEIEKNYQCTICFKRFVTQIKLDKHNRLHILPKSYACVLCSKSFKLKQSLETHEKAHRLMDIKEDEIRKRLIPPIIITDHPFLENVEYKYNCSKCLLKFKSLPHLRYHEAKHIGIKNFKCNICDRRFLTKSSLTCHQLVHNTKSDFKCQICLAKFKTASNLRRHLQLHTNKRNFLCAYCCKTFRRKSNCQLHLNTHIKDVLLELEPKVDDNISSEILKVPEKISENNDIILHSCNVCKKKFKKSYDLERHNRVHTKEKPYSCEKCNKYFTLKGTLKVHMKVHDENRIKSNCIVCGKSYATQSALKLHLRIHTGELPFKCDYCPKMFRTAGHKIAHSKQHCKKKK